MTELTKNVRRKVATLRGQPLVVTLSPEGIWIREPRRRIAYLAPYGQVFTMAARMYADAEMRRRKVARAARRAL